MNDCDDEEDNYGDWIWLPPDEVARLQAKKSKLMRDLVDSVTAPDGGSET